MGAETELKLRLSATDARRVGRLGLLRGIKPVEKRLQNIYYDTPDDALASRKIALRHRRIGRDWLITVKSAGKSAGGLSTRAEWEYPCPPDVHDFSGVDDKALRHFLESARPRLAPLFSTDFRRRAWIIEPHKDLSIELALDEGETIARPAGQPEAPPLTRPICELELELKKGEVLALLEVARMFADRLTLIPETESKAQRGLRLYRGIADAPKAATAGSFAHDLHALAVFRLLAHGCLDHFLGNAEGVRSADSTEYIHQARVALRRLRALLKIYSPLLPTDFFLTYNEGWRHFANRLGDARDLDVLIEETLPAISHHYDGHDAIETFVEYALTRRQQARETARASFCSPELGRMTLDFMTDLARLPEPPDDPPLRKFARRRMRRLLAGIRRNALDLETKSVDQLHRLRIRFKRLRYTLDFFSGLLPAGAVESYAAEVKNLQDQLGRINDLERALAVEALAPDAVRCDLAAGWLSATQRALIDRLPAVAQAFLARPAPWESGRHHIKETK